MPKKLTLEEFIIRSNKKHNNRYDYSLVNYVNAFTKVKIICSIHGIFEQNPREHSNGCNCPKCTTNHNYTKEEFVEKADIIHNNIYDYSLVNYINSTIKVKIICPVHGIFEQRPYSHIQKQSCPYCKKNFKLNNKIFIEKANIIHNNKYDYSLVNYINTSTKIKIICPIHGKFEQTPNNHLNYGCISCSGKLLKTTEQFIIDAKKIHNDKYDYSLVYYKNSKTQIKIICHIHGEFIQTPQSHLNNSGCPKCKESKGEIEIRKILDLKNIEYESQKRFNDCRSINTLPFDFYLPNINTCIEFDGKQHFIPNEIWGGENNLLEIQKRDEIKNNYCEKNNIKLIRIKYDNKLIEKTILELL